MLNVDVKSYLDEFYSLNLTPPYECDPVVARENFRRRMTKFKDGHRIEVGGTDDIRIPTSSGSVRARVYRPLGAASGDPVPTLVFFHGGGWVVGDIDTHDNYARTLCASTRSVVVSVDYRKAPEAPFPAAADDAIDSVRWATAEVGALGGDPRRVAVAGVSAGGNLAAVAALDARQQGIDLALQVLVYPCIDPVSAYDSMQANAEGYLLSKLEMDWYNHHYSGHDPALARDPRRSPIFADVARDLAPAIVVTAEYDPLCDEGNAYAAKLARAGIDTELLCFPGTVHGFFGFGPDVPSAQQAIRTTCFSIAHKLSRSHEA